MIDAEPLIPEVFGVSRRIVRRCHRPDRATLRAHDSNPLDSITPDSGDDRRIVSAEGAGAKTHRRHFGYPNAVRPRCATAVNGWLPQRQAPKTSGKNGGKGAIELGIAAFSHENQTSSILATSTISKNDGPQRGAVFLSCARWGALTWR